MRKSPARPPEKTKHCWTMLAPKNKKELQAFLGVINYLGKFSLSTTDICGSSTKADINKVTWTWNMSCQKLFAKAKSLIKVRMCMKFYDDTRPLYFRDRCLQSWPGSSTITTAWKATACPERCSVRQHKLSPHCIC